MWKWIKRFVFGAKVDSYCYDDAQEVMTVHLDDGTVEKYHGSGTVWHQMPSFKRCTTFTESWLCDLWTSHNFRSSR